MNIEYMLDPALFAHALNEANAASGELLEAENRIREHAIRLGMLPAGGEPSLMEVPNDYR